MQPQNPMVGPLTGQVDELGKRIKALEETLAQLKSLDSTLHEMQYIIYSYVEKIREGVVLIQDEIIIWANKAACDTLGYKLEEVINKSAVELAHPKYRDQLSARYAMLQAGDDIPKKAQEELALRAEMLDLVSDSVFLLDIKGNIKYVNKSACDFLGYTQDEMTGMNIADVNPEEYKEKAKIRLSRAPNLKEARFKTVHMRKDGTRVPVSVRIRVIKRGGHDYILGVVREIVHEEETL
ncbi:MAG: PAS domain S-box protein [Chloroflexi bacterium]|nr:PAS domain S-box protein [Chloroflexota bacterium]